MHMGPYFSKSAKSELASYNSYSHNDLAVRRRFASWPDTVL